VLELFGTDAEMSHSPGSFSVAKIEKLFYYKGGRENKFSKFAHHGKVLRLLSA
jgi:hypothetical protein